MQLTVPSAAPIQISLSANPNQLKTERLEDNARLCGENWLTNLKLSPLKEMIQVPSLSLPSTSVHKFSASKIEEMELENRCSNLLLLEAGKHLPLFHLSCLSLVFLLMCCNVFSLEPTRPMCDGHPPRLPRFFAAWRVEAPFFFGLFRGVLHFVLHLARGVRMIQHPAPHVKKKTTPSRACARTMKTGSTAGTASCPVRMASMPPWSLTCTLLPSRLRSSPRSHRAATTGKPLR